MSAEEKKKNGGKEGVMLDAGLVWNRNHFIQVICQFYEVKGQDRSMQHDGLRNLHVLYFRIQTCL